MGEIISGVMPHKNVEEVITSTTTSTKFSLATDYQVVFVGIEGSSLFSTSSSVGNALQELGILLIGNYAMLEAPNGVRFPAYAIPLKRGVTLEQVKACLSA